MICKRNASYALLGKKSFYFVYGVRLIVSLITESLLYEKYDNLLTPVLNACNFFVLISLIFIIIIVQSYSIKELTVICLLSIIFEISSFKSSQGFIMLSWLFICASKNIDLKFVAKETAFISISIILALIGLTVVGVIDVCIWTRPNGLIRYSIGYRNPNILGYIVFQIIIALIICVKHNFSRWIILFCGFYFSYITLNCRTVAMCIFLLALLDLVFRNCIDKRLKFVGFIITTLSPIFSLYISIIYNSKSSWITSLDKFFSWRIAYANKYIEEYGFSLIGRGMDLTTLGALDNAYVRAIVFYGVIPLIIYTYGVVKLFICKNNSKNIELICIITMILYGLMEPHIFVINRNFTLLILSNVFYKKRRNINLNSIFVSVL